MQLEVAQKLHIFAFDFFIGTSLQELAIDWQNWPSWQQSHQMISTRFGKASARQRWKKLGGRSFHICNISLLLICSHTVLCWLSEAKIS